MKILTLSLLTLLLTSCGYSERGTSGVVQMKRLHRVTPLICGDYAVVDANLGVMQDGQGGASIQDIDLEVPKNLVADVEKALADRTLQVELIYSTYRAVLCGEKRVLESFKVIKHEEVPIKITEHEKSKETVSQVSNSKFQDKCLELAKSVSELEKCKTM